MVDLVLGLEEPHRAVILHRFFAGLSPREIGEREGLPVTTVRSRIAQALERLRGRLDRAHGGNRLAWSVALGALAGLKVEAAAAATAALTPPVSPAVTTWGTMTSGGLIVTTKKLGLAFAASALLLLGIGGFFFAVRHGRERSRVEERVAVREGGEGAGAGAPAAREPLPAGVDAGPAAGTETAAVVAPEAPLSLEGRVVNAEGVGIAGATVTAVEARAWHGILLGIEERYPDPLTGVQGLGREFADLRRRSPAVATGTDGSYTFRGLAEGEYRVLVSHPEHLPGPDARAAVAPGRTARCDVELAPGGSIAGLVLDEEGKPVEGALISSRGSHADSARGMGKIMGLLSRFVEGSALAAPAETRSARDGSFRLQGLEPVLQDLKASLAGRLDGRLHQVPPGAQGVKLVLSRGASVQGRLLDRAGQPAGGARLELKESMGSLPNKDAMMTADLDLLGEKTRSGESDGQGRFLLTGVAPGQYELAIRIGKSPVLVEIIPVGKEPVDMGELTLPDLAPIRGKVLGPKGQPVEGAVVRAGCAGGEGPWSAAIAAAGLEGRSGPGGEFAIAAVPTGTYRLTATAAEYASSVLELVETGASGLVIRLGEPVVIAGVCLEAAGRTPVAGAEVRLRMGGPPQATSDEHGEFLLPCPSPAEGEHTFRFQVSHLEYDGTWEQGSPGAGEPVEVLLKPARGVRGTVRDGQGNPVAGARVQAEVPGLPQVLIAVTSNMPDALAPRYSDAGGRFFVKLPRGGGPLREARVDVAAQHPGHGKGRVTVPPRAKGAAVPDLEIVLAPGVALEGRVLDSSGTPLPGAQVRATLWNDVPLEGELAMMQLLLASSGGTVAYANRAGRFRLPGLEPSLHRLEVTALGYARKTIDSVAAGGGAPALDIVLESGGSISGRVVDLAGAPVAGIEVLAFFAEQPVVPVEDVDITAMAAGQQVARSDRQGVFTLTHLPETVFSLVARAPGFQLARADNVRPGDVFPDLVLVPNGSLSGRILDRETGQPVGFFNVRCVRDGEAEARELRRAATSASNARSRSRAGPSASRTSSRGDTSSASRAPPTGPSAGRPTSSPVARPSSRRASSAASGSRGWCWPWARAPRSPRPR